MERFEGNQAEFWLMITRAFIDHADPAGNLDSAAFHAMLGDIFSIVAPGPLSIHDPSTGGNADIFFALADSNHNEEISFAELVAVFEIESLRSDELREWLAAPMPAASAPQPVEEDGTDVVVEEEGYSDGETKRELRSRA